METPAPPTDERQAYQQLHDENKHYQANNWLMDELEAIVPTTDGGRFIEIGCGNGRFLPLAAARFEHVIGVDWARSPVLDEILASSDRIDFVLADLTSDLLDIRADVLASADVLEHIAPEHLPSLLGRLDSIAPTALHKIACYPDDWRHPSVFSPEQWLKMFREANAAYELREVEHRRGRENQPVAVIVKAPTPIA